MGHITTAQQGIQPVYVAQLPQTRFPGYSTLTYLRAIYCLASARARRRRFNVRRIALRSPAREVYRLEDGNFLGDEYCQTRCVRNKRSPT